MSLVPLYLAVGLVLAMLGMWVLLSRPRERLNQALGALLLLFAGSGVVFQMWREAATAAERVMLDRVGTFYEIPAPLLILVIAERLLQPRWSPRARGLLFAAAGLATGGYFALYALHSPSSVVEVALPGGGVRFDRTPYFPAGLFQLVVFVLEGGLVFAVARAAGDPARGVLLRRQLGLVALAFVFLAGPAGGGALSPYFDPAYSPAVQPLSLFSPLLIAFVLYAAVVVPRAFAPGDAPLLRVALLAPLAAGVFDTAYTLLRGAYGLDLPPWPGVPRVTWVTAFALTLAVAILRYDLAGLQGEARRRRASAARALLGAGVASVGAGAVLSVAGLTPAGLALAALPMAALVPYRAGVLGRIRANAALGVLLDPGDPEVVRERVRVYAEALAATSDPDGRVPDAAQPALRALRAQLGLSQRDHDMLLALVHASADRRAEVAYRVALETAAAAGSLEAEQERLGRLRAELGVSWKQHLALLAEVRAAPPGPPAVLEPGAVLLGRYRVLRSVGRGGFGEAFLARDERLGREVVLKRLAADRRRETAALRRFEREARLAGRLQHPHIVALHDLVDVGGEVFLVMEFCEGGSLADRLRERGPLSEGEARRVALETLEALAALHERGIVHRDVKPGNILFDAAGRAKLGDFTIAKETVSGDTLGGAGGGPAGSLAYMSPEQARGLPASSRSDLYSLGATLYEALSGKPPIPVAGLHEYEALRRVTDERPELPLRGVSRAMNRALQGALANDPQRRFPGAAAMRAALADHRAAGRGAGAGADASPPGTPAGSARRRPRRRTGGGPSPPPGDAS